MDDVVGKKVLITGTTSGIGKQLALTYARMGASVFMTARKENILKEVVDECWRIGREGATFGYMVADMADFKTVAKDVISAAVAALGGLDQLVLNHAQLHEFKRWVGDAADLDNVESRINVNYLSHVHLSAHALSYLQKTQSGEPGRISIVGSIGGKLSMRSGPAYCGSKFALDGFFSSLRELFEVYNTNITVTYSVIGPVLTEKVQSAIIDAEKNPDAAVPDLAQLLHAVKMFVMMGCASMEDVSMRIVRSTTLGEQELYYPHLFNVIPGGYKLLIVLRHYWPSLLYVS